MKVTLETKNSLNTKVIENYSRLKLSLFLVPLFVLSAIVCFLYSKNALSVAGYIAVQKEWFYYINSHYSQFPHLIYNLTQLGDAFIFLSIVSILVVYAPKVWEALLSASVVSALLSNVLKNLFAVPRPAASFDNATFTIIGKTLTGHNSLPSGHSITAFTMLTVLLFSFMPKKISYKIGWTLVIIVTGLLIVFTRVGLGAHYPLDTITGSCIGVISGLAGIFISQKYPIWSWMTTKKYYPVLIAMFLVCAVVAITKIMNENLVVFYFTFLCLLNSLYKISYVYIKK